MPSKRLARNPTRNKETRDEEVPNPASNLPPKAVLDTLPEHVRVAVVEAAHVAFHMSRTRTRA